MKNTVSLVLINSASISVEEALMEAERLDKFQTSAVCCEYVDPPTEMDLRIYRNNHELLRKFVVRAMQSERYDGYLDEKFYDTINHIDLLLDRSDPEFFDPGAFNRAKEEELLQKMEEYGYPDCDPDMFD